jgi:hypothetical protein
MDDVRRWQKHHSVLKLGWSSKFPNDISKHAHTANLWVCEWIKLRNERWRAKFKGILSATLKKWILSKIFWWIRFTFLELILSKRIINADKAIWIEALLVFTDTFRRSQFPIEAEYC